MYLDDILTAIGKIIEYTKGYDYPVSYTHLDVYKRQPCYISPINETRSVASVGINKLNRPFSSVIVPVSVSYTHLDVYKRQERLPPQKTSGALYPVSAQVWVQSCSVHLHGSAACGRFQPQQDDPESF